MSSWIKALNPLDAPTTALAGDDLDDFRVEAPAADLVEKIQQGGATAADEHGKTERSAGNGGKGQLQRLGSRFGRRHAEWPSEG